MEKKTLLFFKLSNSSFVLKDEESLQKQFNVISLNQNQRTGFKQLLYHLEQFFFLVKWIRKTDFLYIWFADYHAFLPLLFSKLFRKNSFLVIGGFDAEKNIELNYGAHIHPFRSWIIKKSCEWSSYILPVSQYTERRLFENLGKNYASKSRIIYNGVDTDFFKPANFYHKKKVVTTICGGATKRRLLVKGIDFFAELAQSMPDISFKIVGLEGIALSYIEEHYPLNNLTLSPPCKPAKIKQHLQESRIICQFSRFESFGMVVVEGMLCACVPVVVNVGGLPEIIHKTAGFILEERTIKAAQRAIRSALETDELFAESLYEKGQKQLSLASREQQILDLLKTTSLS